MFERLMLVLALLFFGLSVFAFVKGLQVLGLRRPARARPTLLYFGSDSCGPCVVQARYLEQVQSDFADRVTIEQIDAVAEQEKAARYGIFRVPATLIIDRHGRVRHINYGLADARKLAHQLHNVEDGPEPTA